MYIVFFIEKYHFSSTFFDNDISRQLDSIFKAPYFLLFDVQNRIVQFVTTFTQLYARTKFFFQDSYNNRLFYTILGHIHLFVATSSRCRCWCGWGFWSFGLISWKEIEKKINKRRFKLLCLQKSALTPKFLRNQLIK